MTFAVVFDSIGFGEWFVLLAVVLVVVGPRRLPSAARTLGQYYARFRRAAENFKRQLLEMDTEISQPPAPTADDAFTVGEPPAAASEPPSSDSAAEGGPD